MELINILVEKYAEKYTSTQDAVLQQIHDDTLLHHTESHMLSSLVQGKLLSFVSELIQPKFILEIGTFTGYSALCLAKGLHKDGALHTIELREKDAQTALKNFSLAKMDNQIHLHVGDASEIIPQLDFKWDLVFIDADKTGYMKYYDLVLPRLSERGLIIADNVLFHGEVLEPPVKGKSAKAIQAFNEHVAADNRTDQVLLTVRDGLLFIKKKNQ